jgi:hypothetical protein
MVVERIGKSISAAYDESHISDMQQPKPLKLQSPIQPYTKMITVYHWDNGQVITTMSPMCHHCQPSIHLPKTPLYLCQKNHCVLPHPVSSKAEPFHNIRGGICWTIAQNVFYLIILVTPITVIGYQCTEERGLHVKASDIGIIYVSKPWM